MTVLSFSHYNLRAARPLLDELCNFYCDVVGLHVGERPPFNFYGFWLYAGERDVLHLTEAKPEEDRQRHVSGTFDHVAFNCENLKATEEHLRNAGIRYRQSTVPLTGRVQIFFSDPAGNGVELNFANEGSDA